MSVAGYNPVMAVSPDSHARPWMPEGWRPVDDTLRRAYPDAPWSWLLETGFLTRRLQAACGDGFMLDVLGEREIVLDEAEARLLDLVPGSVARTRGVHLSCGGTPCISALSLLLLRTLTGPGRYLAKLGGCPLGDALFSNPGVELSSFVIRRSGLTVASG